MVSKTSPTLAKLPFCHITNVELYQLLESVESHIKSCRDDKNVSKHIRATLPDNTIFKTSCKYFTADQLANLNQRDHNTILKLLHHNIRSLDKHYGELVALIQTLGNNLVFMVKVLGWPFYSIRRNMEWPFYPYWMNPDDGKSPCPPSITLPIHNSPLSNTLPCPTQHAHHP